MTYYKTSWWLNDNTEDYEPWRKLDFYYPLFPLIAVFVSIFIAIIWNFI